MSQNSPPVFRYAIGTLAIVGGLIGLAGLYFIEIPEGNKEPLLLAIGIVLGWGATVIGYEFGSSPSARKAAEAGIAASSGVLESSTKISELAASAAAEKLSESPSGALHDPLTITGAGPDAEPVPIINQGEKT